MAGISERKKIIKILTGIVFGKPNDILKLVYMEPEDVPRILDGLDLTMLSEIKKSANGAVEIKLVDKLEAIKILAGLISLDDGADEKTEFIKALAKAADALRRDKSEN